MNFKSGFKTVLAVLVLFCCFAYLWGCGGGSSSGGTVSNPAAAGSGNILSGRILIADGVLTSVLLLDSRINRSVQADASTGKKLVKDAEVWIEDASEIHTKTDQDGNYTLENVPSGKRKVVSKYASADKKTEFKMRSVEVDIDDKTQAPKMSDLELKEAKNSVSGILRDHDGKPLPAGTVLTLWGEKFTVGEGGKFTSPPLPDGFEKEDIKVAATPKTEAMTIKAPFITQKEAPAQIEVSLPEKGQKGKSFPVAFLMARKGGVPASKVGPGEQLTLIAEAQDVDPEDASRLNIEWDATKGTLATSAANPFQAIWTAPSQPGMVAISIRISDPQGAWSSVKLMILVGLDQPPPGPIDIEPPQIAALTPASGATFVSATETLVLRFNEALASSTVDSAHVSALGGSSPIPVLVSLNPDGYSVNVSPITGWPANVPLKVAVTGIRDVFGNLSPAFVLSFAGFVFSPPIPPTPVSTITTPIVASPPAVLTQFLAPLSSATDVLVDSSVTAQFSSSIALDSLTPSNFIVARGGVTLSGGLSLDPGGVTIRFKPDSPFPYSSIITVTLGTGLKDRNGLSLPASFSWSFSVQAPPQQTPGTTNTFVIQPGPEGKDTCYGTVYLTDGRPNQETLYMGGWGDYYYDFFEFDLAQAPMANNTVKVTLYLFSNPYPEGGDPGFQINRITQAWTEAGVTLANNPSSVFYKNFGIFVHGSWSQVDITDLYKSWKDGTYPNFGIKLAPTNSNRTNGAIYSSDNLDTAHRPKLLIEYTSGWAVDATPPTVALTSIASASTNVYPIPVTVTFSEPVTGFDSTKLVITNGTVNAFSGSGAVYTFNLVPTSIGTVTVNIPANAAQDSSNNGNLVAPAFARFFDNVAPTIFSVIPVENATNIATNTQITVTFSEPMATSTISASTFTVASGGTLLAGVLSMSSNGMIATFSPNSTFPYGSLITVNISTGVKDTVGNSLSIAKTWTFSPIKPMPDLTIQLHASNPVLPFSGTGFDYTRVSNPSVIKVNGTYYMFYDGLPNGNEDETGVATSSDGVTWYRPSTPISHVNPQGWFSYRQTPVGSVIFDESVFKYWFRGDTGSGENWGYATSTNGFLWSYLPQNPLTPLLGLQRLVKFGGIYHAYRYRNADGLTYHTTSTDGANFVDQGTLNVTGKTLVAIGTYTYQGIDFLFSIWSAPTGYFHGYSKDGVTFKFSQNPIAITPETQNWVVGGTPITVASSAFSIESVMIENSQIKFWGTTGVGNINWGFGNCVIWYGSASEPDFSFVLE